jgi:hypothetical protein
MESTAYQYPRSSTAFSSILYIQCKPMEDVQNKIDRGNHVSAEKVFVINK